MPRANFKNHGSGPVKKCGLEPRVMGCKGFLSHLLEEARRYVSQCFIPTSVSPIIQKSRSGLEIRCGPDTSIMLSQQLEGTCPQMSWIPHLCLLIHKEVDAYVRRSLSCYSGSGPSGPCPQPTVSLIHCHPCQLPPPQHQVFVKDTSFQQQSQDLTTKREPWMSQALPPAKLDISTQYPQIKWVIMTSQI
ncbi:hypothetical protein Acr_03g0020350 [Actinidia rufa]|uniref:Uncharacterized protein n=1 Tax=Actinidia rufa TaxID=165716 RepID=A0A7J0EFM5_9ERIC|nr:hypothetical protein Acr_03g0020350 [Actinidia rufa]